SVAAFPGYPGPPPLIRYSCFCLAGGIGWFRGNPRCIILHTKKIPRSQVSAKYKSQQRRPYQQVERGKQYVVELRETRFQPRAVSENRQHAQDKLRNNNTDGYFG